LTDQLVDMLTKSLRRPRIEFICSKFKTYNLYAPARRGVLEYIVLNRIYCKGDVSFVLYLNPRYIFSYLLLFPLIHLMLPKLL